MKKFKTLNKNTLEEGFRYLAKKETAFKRILEEKIITSRLSVKNLVLKAS